MANTLNVTLTATDAMSSVITGAVRAATLQANLLASAFKGAAQLAGSAFGKFSEMVKSAADSEVDLIASTGALQGVLGTSFADSLKYAKQLGAQFSQMGSELPGTAEDFAQIGRILTDDLAGAFKRVDGSFDKVGFEEKLMGITRGVGVLAQAAKTSATEAGFAIQRVIGGDANSLKLLFFDKNPFVKNYIVNTLKEQGKTLAEWGSLTQQARLEIVQAALDKAAGPDVIKALQSTVDGIMSSWKSQVFDPSVGALGMLRSLASRGGQTALDGLRKVLQATEGLFSQLAEAWPFKVDLMVALFDGLSGIAKGIDWLTSRVADYLGAFHEGASRWEAFSGMLKRAMKGMEFENALKQFSSSIAGVMGKVDFRAVLTVFPSVFTKLLATFSAVIAGGANALITGANTILGNWSMWGQLGVTLGNVIGRGVAGVLTLLTKLDWGGLVMAGLKAIPAALTATMGIIVGVVSGLIQGLAPTVQSALSGITGVLAGVAKSCATALGQAFESVTTAVRAAFSNLVGSVMPALTSFASSLTDSIRNFFQGVVQQFQSTLSNLASSALSAVGVGAAPAAATTTTPPAAAATTTTTPPATTAAATTNPPSTLGVAPPGNGAAPGWTGWFSRSVSNVLNASTGYTPHAILANYLGDSSNQSRVNSRQVTYASTGYTSYKEVANYLGNSSQVTYASAGLAGQNRVAIPSKPLPMLVKAAQQTGVNVASLLAAVVAERQNSPVNSHIVVANSSETILTAAQTKAVFMQPVFKANVGLRMVGPVNRGGIAKPALMAAVGLGVKAGSQTYPQAAQPITVRNTNAFGGTTTMSPNITVNINGANSDPNTIATMVVAELDNWLRRAELKL